MQFQLVKCDSASTGITMFFLSIRSKRNSHSAWPLFNICYCKSRPTAGSKRSSHISRALLAMNRRILLSDWKQMEKYGDPEVRIFYLSSDKTRVDFCEISYKIENFSYFFNKILTQLENHEQFSIFLYLFASDFIHFHFRLTKHMIIKKRKLRWKKTSPHE